MDCELEVSTALAVTLKNSIFALELVASLTCFFIKQLGRPHRADLLHGNRLRIALPQLGKYRRDYPGIYKPSRRLSCCATQTTGVSAIAMQRTALSFIAQPSCVASPSGFIAASGLR